MAVLAVEGNELVLCLDPSQRIASFYFGNPKGEPRFAYRKRSVRRTALKAL